MPKCEQRCGAEATVYAMGPRAGDWAGKYCVPCANELGFTITDQLTSPSHSVVVTVVKQAKLAFVARCECGWVGSTKPTYMQAAINGDEHRQAV